MPVSRQFENTQRPPSAAAEDRNVNSMNSLSTFTVPQRPPSAAAEDRNVEGGRDERGVGLAAAAVRGGRGSQLRGDARRPRLGVGSGRRPRRPRIAT